MSGVVVDASVAIKWVVDETGSAEAAALLDGRTLHAPPLLFVEVANAFWVMARRGAITRAGAADALDLLRRAPLVASNEDLVSEALRLAQMLDHPVYDCVYLALALLREVPVVTADRRFVAAAARDPDVSLLVLPLEAASREGGGRTGPQ